MKRPTLAQVIAGKRKWKPAPCWPISLPNCWFQVPKDSRPPPGYWWASRADGYVMLIERKEVTR